MSSTTIKTLNYFGQTLKKPNLLKPKEHIPFFVHFSTILNVFLSIFPKIKSIQKHFDPQTIKILRNTDT